MKNTIYIFTVITLVVCCSSDPEFQEVESTNIQVIKGSTEYIDILTDQLIIDDTTIEVSIEAMGTTTLPANFVTKKKGYEFEFGGLKAEGEYLVSALKKGSPVYSVEEMIQSSHELIPNKQLTLTTGQQTLLVAQVLTAGGAPVKDASLMLFNDLSFLLAFGETGGFIDLVQTNTSGKAVFTDLIPGDYYLFPVKVIGMDTLRRDLKNIQSISVIKNQVNNRSVSLIGPG